MGARSGPSVSGGGKWQGPRSPERKGFAGISLGAEERGGEGPAVGSVTA